MKILEKIDNASAVLSEHLSFTDSTVIDDCIDVVKGSYILAIMDKPELSDDDMDLIRTIAKCQSRMLQSEDISNLVVQMKNEARERSHGSAPLYRVFIRDKEYDEMINELGVDSKTKVQILGTTLERTSRIQNSELIAFGLCKPKFKGVPLNMLVVLGTLTR